MSGVDCETFTLSLVSVLFGIPDFAAHSLAVDSAYKLSPLYFKLFQRSFLRIYWQMVLFPPTYFFFWGKTWFSTRKMWFGFPFDISWIISSFVYRIVSAFPCQYTRKLQTGFSAFLTSIPVHTVPIATGNWHRRKNVAGNLSEWSRRRLVNRIWFAG